MTLIPAARGSDRYVVGVGFGALSGRAVVVRVHDGQEPATIVHAYPHATDFGVRTAPRVPPVLARGTPLAETTRWAAHPHARPELRKHHAARDQADRINALAHARGEKWISRYGGRISAESQYAEALQLPEEDPAVRAACARWIEAAPGHVLRRPLALAESEQAPALGSALHAAVAAGAHPDVRSAAEDVVGVLREGAYRPEPIQAGAYDALYTEYRAPHDHFGTRPDGRRRRAPSSGTVAHWPRGCGPAPSETMTCARAAGVAPYPR